MPHPAPLTLLPSAARSSRSASRPSPTPAAGASTLPADLFTRPYADLDDVQARIGTAVAFATERAAGRPVPDALAAELRFAEVVLADLGAIVRPAARHRAFRAEHGFETMKGLWFAFSDHAALLGLQAVAT